MKFHGCELCGRKYVGDKVSEAEMKGKPRPVNADKECLSMATGPLWDGWRCNVCLDANPQMKLAQHWAFGRLQWWARDMQQARLLYTMAEEIELGSDVWREINGPDWEPVESENRIIQRCRHAGYAWSPPEYGQLALVL